MARTLLTLVLLAACTSAEDETGDTAVPEADTCDTIQERATAAVRSRQACTPAVGCEVVDMYEIAGSDNCLGAFQCYNAFPTGADLSGLAADAAAFAAERADNGCTSCVEADCADPISLSAVCNESTGMCEIVN